MSDPRYTLSIDPGLRGCGAAYAVDGIVRRAGYVVGEKSTAVVRASAWEAMAKATRRWLPTDDVAEGELIIELPQVYRSGHQVGRKSGTNPNDLIELAAVVGAIQACLGLPTTVYLPAEWKGQVPKEIVHERARKRLSSEEIVAIEQELPRAGLAHNVWDAVAMVLFHHHRMPRW
jgi:hypothetical protein